MGFRFRKSLRLFPGVRFNFSGSGISTSLGVRGATVNLSRRGTRGTLGLPGTGLSYSTLLSPNADSPGTSSRPANASAMGCGALIAGLVGLFTIGQCSHSVSPPIASTPHGLSGGSTIASADSVMFVAAASLNCRSQASPGAAIVNRLPRGTRVTVFEQHDGWSRLDSASGCWVKASFLTLTAPAAAALQEPIPAVSTRQQQRQLGGGSSCSCATHDICTGSRGGRYCLTSGGNKRYGV